MAQLLNALFSIIFQLFESILQGLSGIVISSVKTRRQEVYNADFLKPEEVLSKHQDGFMYGDKRMSITDAFSHALVVGSSGSGKTSTVLINTLLSVTNCSMVVHDPSGELIHKTSGAKLAQGFAVKVIYLDEPSLSEKYNPLARCKTKSDIKQLCKILIHSTLGAGNGDQFWNSAAESLLALFIRYIIHYSPIECRNLYNVLVLLNTFAAKPKEIDKLIIACNDDELYQEYAAQIRYEPKVLMNILATAKTALSLWQDERIAQITAHDSIDFELLRKEKTVIFIRSNINQIKYYAPLSSLFFEQLFAFVMRNIPCKEELPILCLLDECASLHLPILPVASANLRKYCCGLQLIFQTESQVIDNFGVQAARAIIANCYTKCYLPGQTLETCRQLEILLGKFEFIDDNGVKNIKPLMSMDSIRTMNESILLVGNKPPVKLSLVPYYRQKKLQELSELSPVELKKQDSISPYLFLPDAED